MHQTRPSGWGPHCLYSMGNATGKPPLALWGFQCWGLAYQERQRGRDMPLEFEWWSALEHRTIGSALRPWRRPPV
jgi:hypothetical protein